MPNSARSRASGTSSRSGWALRHLAARRPRRAPPRHSRRCAARNGSIAPGTSARGPAAPGTRLHCASGRRMRTGVNSQPALTPKPGHCRQPRLQLSGASRRPASGIRKTARAQERGHLMKQQVGGGVEHWSAYRGRHGRLFVGAPRTADPPRRWFERLRNRHGGAAYGPPRGTQAENYGLTHRVSTMYRVAWPIYAHSSITACADAVCGRTLARHAFFEHPSSRFRARRPGRQPAHAREDAEARSRRGAAGSGGCRRAGRQEAGARAAHRCLARAGLVGLLGSRRINGLVRQWCHRAIVEVIESAGAAVGTR
jgi:hypothetical protein